MKAHPTLWLVFFALSACNPSCRGCNRDLNRVFDMMEMVIMLGAICLGLVAMVLAALLIWVIARNFRAPTAVSTVFARIFGVLMVLSGALVFVGTFAEAATSTDRIASIVAFLVWAGLGVGLFVSGQQGAKRIGKTPLTVHSAGSAVHPRSGDDDTYKGSGPH